MKKPTAKSPAPAAPPAAEVLTPELIDSLTLAQAKDLVAALGGFVREVRAHPYPIGSNVFIRTVTMNFTGLLVEVTPDELVIQDAAWIADTGRFAASLSEGTLVEVEPYPEGRVVVSRAAVIDVSEWRHPLPRETK